MKAYTQIPPGTQIVIGRAARRRRVLERAICSVFEGWSYEEIIPPIFDYYDVFAKGMGTGPEEQIYRFIDREGNILALRPERSEEHTSELQSLTNLVCRLLLEK